MKREEKSTLISALQSSLKDANGVFVVENHGLTVKEMEGLRNELRPLVSVFKVVKNRLMKLALQDTDFAPVSDLMKRPTAVAVATDGLAVTKVLVKFAEEHPNLTIVGGKMDADDCTYLGGTRITPCTCFGRVWKKESINYWNITFQ